MEEVGVRSTVVQVELVCDVGELASEEEGEVEGHEAQHEADEHEEVENEQGARK